MTHRIGFVSIVGAGPGDPELLTVKALRCLQKADVVVYDRLISDAILSLIPQGIVRIFAGKSCKQHFMKQDEINTLLVTLAKNGRQVVRLKGGDPFIFGRGGEEAEHLAAHAIPFEIVPGISSASGCSAYAGIPLTHRGVATGVRYLTGHRQGEQDIALPWQRLAEDTATTLVVYMGLANLKTVTEQLITHGRDASTPVAVIQEGTLGSQKRVTGSLDTIVALAEKANIGPPALAIIGSVVELADKLDWFKPRASPDAPNELPRSQIKARR